jgi:hypothetical protein
MGVIVEFVSGCNNRPVAENCLPRNKLFENVAPLSTSLGLEQNFCVLFVIGDRYLRGSNEVPVISSMIELFRQDVDGIFKNHPVAILDRANLVEVIKG